MARYRRQEIFSQKSATPEKEDARKSHDGSPGNHPDYSHIASFDADLYGRSGNLCSVLTHEGTLKAIADQVRFARARIGKSRSHRFCRGVNRLRGLRRTDEAFLLRTAHTICRAVHGTVLAETNRPIVQPCPADLSALDQLTLEALRTLFQKDLLARSPFSSLGGLFDRTGGQWLVIDLDGTRQAARKPALPQTKALPAPHRRFEAVCAPGYLGR